jgi:hypothetical protein
LVSIDFFTVPTASLRVLFVLVVLAHHHRCVVHFNVTEHPTAVWTAQRRVEVFTISRASSRRSGERLREFCDRLLFDRQAQICGGQVSGSRDKL